VSISDYSYPICMYNSAPFGVITTVAGDGTGISGYSGDGQQGIFAKLSGPNDVSFDRIGRIYISDSSNHAIRILDSDGLIWTIAGNGTAGFSGDGVPATNACLNTPHGISIDLAGKIYFADSGNAIIRMLDPNGLIHTVAGTPQQFGYSGDGGPATSAQLDHAYGVHVDQSGRIFIADTGNFVIRMINVTGTISTFAGIGVSGYSGDLEPSTSAKIGVCYGISVDNTGRLFIADASNHVIRMVGLSGIIHTVAGNGTAGYSGDGDLAMNAMLNGPEGVFVDQEGRIFISDTYNRVIRMIDSNGIIRTIAGIAGSGGYSGDGGQALSAQLSPSSVKVDQTGRVYVADAFNSVIRMFRVPSLRRGKSFKLL
jgi:sugar lactone lactonase YvrE